MSVKPDFTPDELAVVQRWLKQQALSSYSRAPIAYAKQDNARAVLLYEESDTAWRWLRQLNAEQAKADRSAAS